MALFQSLSLNPWTYTNRYVKLNKGRKLNVHKMSRAETYQCSKKQFISHKLIFIKDCAYHFVEIQSAFCPYLQNEFFKVALSNTLVSLKIKSNSTIKQEKSRKNCKTRFCVHCWVEQASISVEHYHVKLPQWTPQVISEGAKALSNLKVKFKKKLKSTSNI